MIPRRLSTDVESQFRDHMTLFIVDDTTILRQRLSALIADITGISLIGSAERASEATDAITATRPDIVILDLRLAEGSGLEVLKNVKRLETPPTVIVFTDQDTSQHRKMCLEHGADYFLGKTDEIEQMEIILRQIQPGVRSDV
jgi:two-component system, NarL family, response regulator DevR